MRIQGIQCLATFGFAVLPLRSFADQGAVKNEILIGTIQDLSRPLAAYSKEAVNGMNMRLDELTAAGGVNGRKIRLLVEDSGYDTKKAMLAAQKLARNRRSKLAGPLQTMRTRVGLS